MPEMSSARAFVRAIQTRSTNTTRSLDSLFVKNPGGDDHPQKSNSNYDLLKNHEDVLSSGTNGGLPSWAKAELSGAGIAHGPELDHIDHWPADQREEVRAAIQAAVEGNVSIFFHWELHDGNDEATVIGELDTGDITITFKSPKWKVRVAGPDNIVVDV